MLCCVQVFRVQMCKWQLDVHNLNVCVAVDSTSDKMLCRVQLFRVQMCKWQLDVHNLNVCVAVDSTSDKMLCRVQVFRVQMCKWQLDVHNLNQFIAELKRTSPTGSVSDVVDSATELNGRWNELTLNADEREAVSYTHLTLPTILRV